MSIRRNRKSSGLRTRIAAVAAAGAVVTTGGVLAAASPASAASGSIVSDTTIAQAAKRAGLAGCRGVPASTWVAIALAESRGNTHAHATGIEDSRGLWQVNLWANSDLVGGRNLYDVSNNAWAARRVCARQGPTAWSTYTNGAYKHFLARGRAAAARV
ncbi:transglycosylase [Pseudofrankia sp. DC12]|uniref:transglycosylase n=1 Tax=Pseudofrankia sp. DC12 TaxID=683315 RepID=UPI001E2B09E1|nr:transglycosylase [Pseudofrankia sp. DC12]